MVGLTGEVGEEGVVVVGLGGEVGEEDIIITMDPLVGMGADRHRCDLAQDR